MPCIWGLSFVRIQLNPDESIVDTKNLPNELGPTFGPSHFPILTSSLRRHRVDPMVLIDGLLACWTSKRCQIEDRAGPAIGCGLL